MARPRTATSVAAVTLVEYVELGETEQGIPVNEFFLSVEERDWVQFSECLGADQELFFLSPESKKVHPIAAAMCEKCAVAVECLAFSIVTKQDWGVWGGMPKTPRATFRKRLMGLARKRGRVWHRVGE